jgi:hypothetical protein
MFRDRFKREKFGATNNFVLQTREIWGYEQFVCVLKFDSPYLRTTELSPLPLVSTADSLRHHCKLGGGSASISGTSLYRGSMRGRRVVRRPRRAKSDYPTTGDRGPHSRQAGVTRPGLTAGALGPSIVSLHTNTRTSSTSSCSCSFSWSPAPPSGWGGVGYLFA